MKTLEQIKTDYTSTKVTDSEGSDGFYWNDKDGFVEVAADCVFRY